MSQCSSAFASASWLVSRQLCVQLEKGFFKLCYCWPSSSPMLSVQQSVPSLIHFVLIDRICLFFTYCLVCITNKSTMLSVVLGRAPKKKSWLRWRRRSRLGEPLGNLAAALRALFFLPGEEVRRGWRWEAAPDEKTRPRCLFSSERRRALRRDWPGVFRRSTSSWGGWRRRRTSTTTETWPRY